MYIGVGIFGFILSILVCWGLFVLAFKVGWLILKIIAYAFAIFFGFTVIGAILAMFGIPFIL